MEHQEGLDGSLTQSVSSDKLGELATTVADVGFDAVIRSGALDGVPVFGLLGGFWKAGRSIQAELFVRKICRFLQGVGNASQHDREQFVRKIENQGKSAEFGEAILLILERVDEIHKPKIIGRVMAAHISGAFDYDTAMRLAASVNRAFLYDLRRLKEQGAEDLNATRDLAEALFTVGLARSQTTDGMFDPSIAGIQSYHLNSYGELLLKHGL